MSFVLSNKNNGDIEVLSTRAVTVGHWISAPSDRHAALGLLTLPNPTKQKKISPPALRIQWGKKRFKIVMPSKCINSSDTWWGQEFPQLLCKHACLRADHRPIQTPERNLRTLKCYKALVSPGGLSMKQGVEEIKLRNPVLLSASCQQRSYRNIWENETKTKPSKPNLGILRKFCWERTDRFQLRSLSGWERKITDRVKLRTSTQHKVQSRAITAP